MTTLVTTSTSIAASGQNCVADLLGEQVAFAVVFGGQGADWFRALTSLAHDIDTTPLAATVTAARRLLEPVATELTPSLPTSFRPIEWLAPTHDAPPSADRHAAAIAVPGILLTQLAAIQTLRDEGLDLTAAQPVTVLGHSQGILGARALDAISRGEEAADVKYLAFAQLIGAAAEQVGRRVGLSRNATHHPMVAISNITITQLRQALNQLDDHRRPAIAAINGTRSFTVSGTADSLKALRTQLDSTARERDEQLRSKKTGGAAFAAIFNTVDASVGFHHPALEPAVDLVRRWATACGLDGDEAAELAEAILVRPVDWATEVARNLTDDVQVIIDLGPHNISAKFTAAAVRGRGIATVAAATDRGREELFTMGGELAVPRPWSDFMPGTVDLGDGTAVLDTAFTRLTGRSPVILAGMTPTTVDPHIVAAAANAGYWAELAGGGQVTAEIFDAHCETLASLLKPGVTVQFNALYLDPYLWRLHFAGQGIVTKARQAGVPFDGVVVSAGIPERDEARELVTQLLDAGFSYVALKPGTVQQIKQVIALASDLADDHPDFTVIVQIEGGIAGGHHSWEDLDDVLLATYADLRAAHNIVVCVGGGIGTPDRAADYLLGRWSVQYGEMPMPVDGVLVGTAAMACAEATTSEAVKQLLVDTAGTDTWVGRGTVHGGVTSGMSQLGADLHEIDNAASRCGRLLDSVAGDADAVAARRDDIVDALNSTAKPYFGDITTMTYESLLRRFAELTTNSSDTFDEPSWQSRFADLVNRAVARNHDNTSGPVDTLNVTDRTPTSVIDELVATYPSSSRCELHPADVSYVLTVCSAPGKPVPFVPTLDADVRRWWRSDSLWQAHDERYDADQVIVIPGPVSVGGITTANEPVADVLARFEHVAVAAVVATHPAEPAISRRVVGPDLDILHAAIAAPDVSWAGRTVDNPLRRLGSRHMWQRTDDGFVLDHCGATVTQTGKYSMEVVVPLGDQPLVVPMTMPDAHLGAGPVMSADTANNAMATLAAVAAGGDLPQVVDGVAQVSMSGDQVATCLHDHSAVTAITTTGRDDLPTLDLTTPVPDALVGTAWPAVFAVITQAHTPDGTRIVEGLLDLVHLDHTLVATAPGWAERARTASELHATATLKGVDTTTAGTVITITTAYRADDTTIAECSERFMIRGRLGHQALTEPDDVVTGVHPTDISRLATVTLRAPSSMNAFAAVSGDRNPLHTNTSAARLAGFDHPIVHGMWLSAVAQRVASTAGAVRTPRTVTTWQTRWISPVLPGAEITVEVDRTGVRHGNTIATVTCRCEGTIVMVATAEIEPVSTVYAFPGQGIQHQNMGMDARATSAAARNIWDRADKHTRSALGFSILTVVRDNPVEISADGNIHRHPDGVLYLTQFTQVAMATLAVATVEHMRETGVFNDNAIACGHSVGEYNALAAVSGFLPLEALLEIVFRRGMAMHHLVPRDSEGRSNYRLAAIRPSQADLADDEITGWIAELSHRTGEFLEIVNYNLAGSQYAVAGTIAGLDALESELDTRRAAIGGKRAYLQIPGIDVPFHSAVLRPGVGEFREHLEQLVPRDIPASQLVGKYIPNLLPRLFTLSRDYISEVNDLVDTPILQHALDHWDDASSRPDELARTLLIELLAWQFASPVRWIETQNLLFADCADGGLGVEQFLEVGVANAPTLANLASQTLNLPLHEMVTVQVLNSGRDHDRVFATDQVDPPHDASDDEVVDNDAGDDTSSALAAPTPTEPAAPQLTTGTDERPADLEFTAADAATYVVAHLVKTRPDQITSADTIETLCDGVSSRRNQVLVDLGAELNVGAIDGAADAPWNVLLDTVGSTAKRYAAFGPVLSDIIESTVRARGAKPAAIDTRVSDHWQLGHGWTQHIRAEVAALMREGTSTRGGDLGQPADTPLPELIDTAVQSIAGRRQLTVVPPSAAPTAGATVDSAALNELRDDILGRDGVLVRTANHLLVTLNGHPSMADLDTDDVTQHIVDAVTRELGATWPNAVDTAFDEHRAVLLDDRWASVREDFARAWDGDTACRTRTFDGLDTAGQQHARWWLNRARTDHRCDLISFYGSALAGADRHQRWAHDTAIVTGASTGSIAAAVIADLLAGGATVVATTSSLTDSRLVFWRDLYRDHASVGAKLWVIPANLASFADIDSVIDWVSSPVVETAAGVSREVRPALTPTMIFPFAAPAVVGTAADAGPAAELAFRVLVWGVERLVTGLADRAAARHLATRVHVVLPGSPNRGMFGGDGAYGEAKAAFDAFTRRWNAEKSWADSISLVHAQIGWVRGTNLMGHNDSLVDAAASNGIDVYTPEQMASLLLDQCTATVRERAAQAPVTVDLSGGLGDDVNFDALRDLADQRQPDTTTPDDDEFPTRIAALTHPAGWASSQPTAPWGDVQVPLDQMVVIIGAGEVGPCGSSRTRFDLEIYNELSPAGVIELAWMTGAITWETNPAGWVDAETGDPLTEEAVIERFAESMAAKCGVREFSDDGALVDASAPLMANAYLDSDTTFTVRDEAEALAIYREDPDHTRYHRALEGDWVVTRLAGSQVKVPRRVKLSRFVGAQVPDGFDPKVWGLGSMTESIDRLAAWNLVSTVDAFISSGVTPAELLRWVHPVQVANTQGTGIGGMQSTRQMYINNLLDEPVANDILQEALPNVIAAHAAQSFIGGYGSMVHPVAACATAAVSVEEAVDKIKLGKASVVVAGGFDDLGIEGIVGFGAMSATADSAAMLARGIDPSRVSRPNDRRRGGFVEGQGGGTVVLARADIAAEHGLPVVGVVAYAASFGDGMHTSIPAPGLGVISAANGGLQSPLATALRAHGLSADDVSVVYKHDTSTSANDPNESLVHEQIAASIGRTPGNPLYVVSQKSLTGHAKGGAAAFQMIGLCQAMADGVIPPNRSLDCVDDELADYQHLVWLRQPLHTASPIKAGLVTSLGFGHVSALIALVHPGAFVAALGEDHREAYLQSATARRAIGERRRLAAMHGGDSAFTKTTNRRFTTDEHKGQQHDEIAMLLNPHARLGADGTFSTTQKNR